MPIGPFSIDKNFLQGTEDGCIRVEAIPHVIIYRIPRNFAKNIINNAELKRAGIYLLVDTTKNTLYVGQADARNNGNGILCRMLEPHNEKVDQWNVGYAIITPISFGATELNHLEKLFYDEALFVGQYTILNGNRPHASGGNYSMKMQLDNFTDFSFFLLRVEMGCRAFVKRNNPDILYIKGRGAFAKGILQEENKMLVFSGSQISATSNLSNQYKQENNEIKRQQLMSDGTIQNLTFMTDYVFSSPSTAATIILGTSSSGNDQWKNEAGKALGDLRKKNQQ